MVFGKRVFRQDPHRQTNFFGCFFIRHITIFGCCIRYNRIVIFAAFDVTEPDEAATINGVFSVDEKDLVPEVVLASFAFTSPYALL